MSPHGYTLSNSLGQRGRRVRVLDSKTPLALVSSKGLAMQLSFLRRSLLLLTLAVAPFATPLAASAAVGIGVSVSVGFAPPALPVYTQPPIPAPGYLWTPGYWAWAPTGYYWVPGTWVQPPVSGYLWTPGYWGWANGAYLWHPGYWGPHVGFYGGINYGFGYTGVGFAGGYWRGGAFFYNRAVLNVGGIHVNVFARPVVARFGVSQVSFNGGVGGVIARPTRGELIAAHERHIAFTSMQREHIELAARNPSLRASANGGRPAIAATARPGQFSGRGVARARGFQRSAHFNGARANAERAGGRAYAQNRADRPEQRHAEPRQHQERGNARGHERPARGKPKPGGHGEHPDNERHR